MVDLCARVVLDGARQGPWKRSAWRMAHRTGCSARCGRLTCPALTASPRKIDAGQVYVNTYGAGGGVELPFGGFKKSGYGREKGSEALDTFTATKTVVVQL